VPLDFVTVASFEAQVASGSCDVRQAHFYGLALGYYCVRLMFVELSLASFAPNLLFFITFSRLQSSIF